MEKTKHDQTPTSEINRTLINIKKPSDNINNDNRNRGQDSCVIDSQKRTCSKYTTMQQESEFKTKRCNDVREKTLTLTAAKIKCNHCQRVCKSSQGLKLHIKACKERLSRNVSRENHVNYCKLKITSVRKGNKEDIAKQHEITEGMQKMIPSEFS